MEGRPSASEEAERKDGEVCQGSQYFLKYCNVSMKLYLIYGIL